MTVVAAVEAAAGMLAVVDMICIVFFFLLHPGKYMGTKSDTIPFSLQDVQFWIGTQCFSAVSIPIDDLQHVTFTTLTFTTQKNGVRGEVIGLGCSGNASLCPILALA